MTAILNGRTRAGASDATGCFASTHRVRSRSTTRCGKRVFRTGRMTRGCASRCRCSRLPGRRDAHCRPRVRRSPSCAKSAGSSCPKLLALALRFGGLRSTEAGCSCRFAIRPPAARATAPAAICWTPSRAQTWAWMTGAWSWISISATTRRVAMTPRGGARSLRPRACSPARCGLASGCERQRSRKNALRRARGRSEAATTPSGCTGRPTEQPVPAPSHGPAGGGDSSRHPGDEYQKRAMALPGPRRLSRLGAIGLPACEFCYEAAASGSVPRRRRSGWQRWVWTPLPPSAHGRAVYANPRCSSCRQRRYLRWRHTAVLLTISRSPRASRNTVGGLGEQLIAVPRHPGREERSTRNRAGLRLTRPLHPLTITLAAQARELLATARPFAHSLFVAFGELPLESIPTSMIER